jgi:hypothetical protein
METSIDRRSRTSIDKTTTTDAPPQINNSGSLSATRFPAWAMDPELVPPTLRPRGWQVSQPTQLRDSKGQSMTARPSKVLATANRAVVVGWSSMGLGHTGRAFAPIQLATEDGTLRAGDVVIAYVPLPWGDEQKQISANSTLNNFRTELQKKGIRVAFVRADKTVRADYIPPNSFLGKPGHSNNVAAMTSFALQPYRSAPPAASIEWDDVFEQTEALGERLHQTDLDRLPVTTANAILAQLQASANVSRTTPTRIAMRDPNERSNPFDASTAKPPLDIAVLTDMDPYLAKAACRAEIPSVSQSNHANLFSLPSDESAAALKVAAETNRTLFIWSKVEYGAPKGHLHAEISTSRNTLSSFKPAAKNVRENYNINEDTSKEEARKAVTQRFLAQGTIIAAKSDAYNGEPGIFVSDHEPQNIVLLYTQALTTEYGRHILKKMEEGDTNYAKTMFVVCAPGSFSGGVNALQVGMFANAGIVMAGGFGTTSEAWYALEHGDYQGVINVRPVPFQREQETNANRMQAHFEQDGGKSRPVVVSSDSDWSGRLDQMVQIGVAQRPTGDMKQFFRAIEAEGSNAEHTKKLLFDEEQPTATEHKMNSVLTASREDAVTKANFRLLTKVIVPTLLTIANNGGKIDEPFQYKITQNGATHTLKDLDVVIETLADDGTGGRLSQLLGVNISCSGIGIYKTDIIEALTKLKYKSDSARSIDAKNLLAQLNESVSAGA